MLLAYCGGCLESSAEKSSRAVLPNVRAKRATTAGRQARAGENVPRTARPGPGGLPLTHRLSDWLGVTVDGWLIRLAFYEGWPSCLRSLLVQRYVHELFEEHGRFASAPNSGDSPSNEVPCPQRIGRYM